MGLDRAMTGGATSTGRRRLRICILTTAHVSNNPRVVKEADALDAAGHAVRVVAYDRDAEAGLRDAELTEGRGWRLASVPIHPRSMSRRVRWALSGVKGAGARSLFDRGVGSAYIRDTAISKHWPSLVSEASREPADVVIGHHAPALPAAARAARRLGARLVFDFEDLHVGNLGDSAADAAEARLIAAIDRAYLPRCALTLASSESIAAEVARRYGVSRPVPILNTFPLDSVRACTARRDRVSDAPSFYWFSQVVGPRRGLEEAVAALARADVEAELHLRGAAYGDFAGELRRLAASLGMRASLHFHELAPPGELVAIAAQHDVGLALEQDWSLNARLALSNKLLTYLVAGNAVLATDTPGQREALDAAPGAALAYRAGDVAALAEHMRLLATDRAALESSRRAARAAAVRRFAWEHDRTTLVAAVESVVA